MSFNSKLYKEEMLGLINEAINKMKETHADFEIYTASIWTDPNACASAISFDTLENSKKRIQKSNEWNKKHHDRLIEEEDYEQAELFKPIKGRNVNPADFELRDFGTTDHQSFELDWEENSSGDCWDELEPALIELGEYAFKKMQELNIKNDFELSVNGRNDWYEYVWNKSGN